MKTRPSTFEQLRELMAWKRDGLLTEAEYERAKGKILGEEPHHAWRACLRLSPSGTWQGKRWPGGGERQNARLFAKWVILEVILVGGF